MTYYYIRGRDPSNVQLLCEQESSIGELNQRKWEETISEVMYSNPLEVDTLPYVGSYHFVCNKGNTTVSAIELIIHGLFLNKFTLENHLLLTSYLTYSPFCSVELHRI